MFHIDVEIRNLFIDILDKRISKKNIQRFLKDLIGMERRVPLINVRGNFKKTPGIYQLDFLKMMRSYNIKLSEKEKELVKKYFGLKINNNFLNLEGIYDIFYDIN